jgi:hypothetical protein
MEQNDGAEAIWVDTYITMAAAEIQWQSSQGVVIGIEARPHTIGG